MITDYEDNLNSVYPGPFKHIKVFIKTFMRRKETSKLKLINSLTEHRIRQGFIESKGRFFASEEGKNILALLESSLGEIRSIYMLRYLWDEGEEWYDFLVNGDAVVEIEREECFGLTACGCNPNGCLIALDGVSDYPEFS